MPSESLPLFPWRMTALDSSPCSMPSLSIQRIAVDLFVLGYADHANKLVDTICKHLPAAKFDFEEGLAEKPLYYAWEGTHKLPSALAGSSSKLHPGPNNHPAACYTLDFVREQKKKPADAWPAKSGIDIALMHLYEGKGQWPFARRVTIGGVVKLCLQKSNEEKARETVQQHVPDVFRKLHKKLQGANPNGAKLRQWLDEHLGLQEAPEIWTILKNCNIGRDLEIHEQALDAYVNEGCELIEKRFKREPPPSFPDKSITELVVQLNEHAVHSRRLQLKNAELNDDMDEDEYPDVPETLLNPPATRTQISELEKRLSQTPVSNSAPNSQSDEKSDTQVLLPDGHLPDDYKEFLRATNGLDHNDDEASPGIYCAVVEVGVCDVENIRNMNCELFPSGDISRHKEIDRIPFGHDFTCIRIGGEETFTPLVLIPPSSMLPILDRFKQAYANATDRQKQIYERAALDVYGGIDKLRNATWLCIRINAEYAQMSMYSNFRDYLVSMVRVEEQGIRDLEADLRMCKSGELVGDTVVRKDLGKRKREEGGEADADEDEETKQSGDGRKEAKTDGL